ncbi:hypothetical protein T492DRAFT_850014 [Pavlovales sp. CCMP2436]|nr:hypothetical protein T492DRAFT_850014 [Pavlovales sp. CCMP2436]
MMTITLVLALAPCAASAHAHFPGVSARPARPVGLRSRPVAASRVTTTVDEEMMWTNWTRPANVGPGPAEPLLVWTDWEGLPVLGVPGSAPTPGYRKATSPLTPGRQEDTLFVQSPEVAFWRDWNDLEAAAGTSGVPQASALVDLLVKRVSEAISRDPARAASYFAYHTARSAFFTSQWFAVYAYVQAMQLGRAGPAVKLQIDPTATISRLPKLILEVRLSISF